MQQDAGAAVAAWHQEKGFFDFTLIRRMEEEDEDDPSCGSRAPPSKFQHTLCTREPLLSHVFSLMSSLPHQHDYPAMA